MIGQQFGTAQRASGLGVQRLKRGYFKYILRASFSAAIPAPLPASLPIDIGPPLTIADASSVYSQSGGELVGDGAASSNAMASVGIPRVAGIATRMRWRRVHTSSDLALRLVGTSATDAIRMNGTGLLTGSAVTLEPVAPMGPAETIIVARSLGSFAFMRETVGGPYKLLWVESVSLTTDLFPRVLNSINAGGGRFTYVNDFDTFDLAAIDTRFGSDYGFALSYDPDGIANMTMLSSPDALTAYTVNYVAGTTDANVQFRRQLDGQYYWRVRVQPSGSFTVYEYNGALNTRINSGAVVPTSGPVEIRIIAEGATIKIFVNNVIQFTSTTAPINPDASYVLVMSSSGTSISSLASWPRTTLLPEGV